MSDEVPNTDRVSSADIISSLTSASSELWGEVAQRLTEAEEGRGRVADTVDHLEEVAAGVAATLEEEPPAAIAPVRPEEVEVPRHAEARIEEPKEPEGEEPEAEEPREAVAEAEGAVAEAEEAGLEESWVKESAVSAISEEEVAGAEEPWLESPVAPEVQPEIASQVEALGEVRAGEPIAAQRPLRPVVVEPEEPSQAETERPATVLAEEPVVEPMEPAAVVAEEPVFVQPEKVEAAAEERFELVEQPSPEPVVAAAAARPSAEPEGASAGIRVLSPERVVDMNPAVVDALLAAEFGEAAARVMEPDALDLGALLGDEFQIKGLRQEEQPATGTEVERRDWTPTPPPPPAPKLPPPPSQPLPPPPSSLLPPPPRTDVPESSRPAPLRQTAETLEDLFGTTTPLQAEPYVQVSPSPSSFESPGLAARPAPPEPEASVQPEIGSREPEAAPEPTVPQTSEPTPPLGFPRITGTGSREIESAPEIPPLSFEAPVFGNESTLPFEAPPIPAPETTSFGEGPTQSKAPDIPALSFESPPFKQQPSTVTNLPQIPLEIAGVDALEAEFADVPEDARPFEVASDLPPLSFESPIFSEPSPESTPEDGSAEGGRVGAVEALEVVEAESELPPPPHRPLPTALASEILSVAPESPSPQSAEEEAPGDQSNVVSEDFTIISKKHRRFRLR